MLRFSLFFCSLLFFLLPLKSFAQESGIKISPAFIDVVLEQGEEEKDLNIEVENLTNETIQLSLSAIDFRQANETGGIDFLGIDAQNYSYSLASFLSFETTSITLEKGEKDTIDVKIINRPDLSPGGHYAAVVGHLVTENNDEGESAQVRPAVSSLIMLRKTGGEVFSLSLLETNWSKTIMFGFPTHQLQLLFQNEGNVHLIPYGTVTITDIFGQQITKGTINNASSIIFPEAQRLVDVRLNEFEYYLPLSFITMDIKGHDSIDKTTFVYQQTALLINPIVIIVIVLLAIGLIYLRKRKKNAKEA